MPDDDTSQQAYQPAVPLLATVQALGQWLRDPIPDDELEYATVLLEAVSAYIREATEQTWLNESSTAVAGVPESIRVTALQMAGRIWRNAEGVIQDTAGPFTSRWSETVADGLSFTSAEREIVGKYRRQRKAGLFSLGVTMGGVDEETLLAEVDPYREGWPR